MGVMVGRLLPGVEHIQNLHPLAVHFPIPFLIGGAFFYFLSLSVRKEWIPQVAFWMLISGAVSMLAAVGTGLYAEDGVMVSTSVRSVLLEPHKKIILVSLALTLLLALWSVIARPFPRKGRLLYIALYLLLLGLITKGADFGARMVFDYNAGGNACPQPIEFSR